MTGRSDRRRPAIAFLFLMVASIAEHPTRAAGADVSARVAVLAHGLPNMDRAVTEAVVQSLRRSGFEVASLSADDVCDPTRLSAQEFFLYVIPHADGYPAKGADALTAYLHTKGNLLVLGTPFCRPLWKHQNQWVGQMQIREAIAQQKPDRILFDFDDRATPAGWTRHRTTPRPSRIEVVAGGAEGTAACLKMTIDYESGTPDGWGTALEPAAGRSGGMLCFWAKGDGRTARLAVRLVHGEKPEDRGIAVVSLTRDWQHYALRPQDFRVLGQADPYQARRVEFVLVNRDITPFVADGEHSIWIDQIGTAPIPFSASADLERERLPLVETLSPGYKTYPLHEIASLEVVPGQAILSDIRLPVPREAASCYARPEGKGFPCGYRWRWIPLVQARDRSGVDRGTPIWMLLNRGPLPDDPAFTDAVARLAGDAPRMPSFEGSVCAVCAISDSETLTSIAGTSLLGDLARRIRRGLFFSHAGAEQFSYWPGEDIRLGAKAVNQGIEPAAVDVRVRVCPASGGAAVFQREATIEIPAGRCASAAFHWSAPRLTADRYTVTAELVHQGAVIDVIRHELGVLSAEKPPRDAFVTVQGGDFRLEGKPWYPVGVNYWPRYAIGLECADYVYHWLTPGFYNPEQVERDLAQLESLGANFLAIRVHAENDRRTILDFLRRAGHHGMRVFVFVSTHVITDDPHYFQGIMMPFHFQLEAVDDFIRSTRLADNPTLMGWDLIWEPAGWVFSDNVQSFGWKGDRCYRNRWDEDWARWIDQRYGTLANAEADWGMRAPRRGDQVTSPSGDQLREDGPWRVMVAAYRRFMDNLMSRYWNDAVRKLRRIDPNHLISFRQGNLPSFDFTLTATPKHVDFFAMEGYSFRPGTSGEATAGFINRYIPYATKGKPYLWIEFGSNVWDRNTMQVTPETIEAQAAAHEMIYRLALSGGANGAAPWWWAGGYRVSERSDYGIINPDGTLRPSGRLLEEYARRFRAPRTALRPDVWFTLDRDAHSAAHYRAARHEGAAAFQKAAAEGRTLGIRSPATGTTSADTPLLAVGNTLYNGRNPPKYLDAEFNDFAIKVGDGPWIEVSDGARLHVPAGQPVRATASVGNLQEATWLAPARCAGKPGGVYLAATSDSQLQFKQAIPKDTAWLEDTDFGDGFLLARSVDAPTRVELQMTAEGRAWFGEKRRFTLEPSAEK